MPSTSLVRRGRVVTEMDKLRSSSFVCSSMRVSVVLPAPDGEDKISMRPRCVGNGLETAVARLRGRPICESFGGMGSLYILNLLTQLLDLGAQFEADRRERGVV